MPEYMPERRAKHMIKLYDAVDDYNKTKRRENQRPRWGVHISETHIAAIADTPIPPETRRDAEAQAKGKSKAAPKHVAKSSSSTSTNRPGEAAQAPREPPTPPPAKGGKGSGKGQRSFSHRGGDWNYTGYNRGWRGW